jgi:hypothetical protein
MTRETYVRTYTRKLWRPDVQHIVESTEFTVHLYSRQSRIYCKCVHITYKGD